MIRRSPIAAALLGLVVWLAARPAAADSFGGFSGIEAAYLVGNDRVCAPLAVEGGVATGAPVCQKANDADLAQLSIKPPKAERGRDATFTATAKGRTLTIRRGDEESPVVTWQAADPISKVNDLFLSTYADYAAVEYVVRRGGRDVTDVVAFTLRAPGATTDPTTATSTTDPTTAAAASVEPPPATPALTKAVKAARKAAKGAAKKAVKAWTKVLAIDPDHSEARLGLAVAQARAKQTDAALATLEALAASPRTDAIEFLIKARFDKAFAAIRADARYRAATGLDRPYGTFYERLMGNGGTWEQAGTSCDTPGVALVLQQDRSFKLKVSGNCSGDKYAWSFKGTWKPNEPVLTLILPNKGKPDESFDCQISRDGDEDAIQCTLDQDLSFVVRPVRR